MNVLDDVRRLSTAEEIFAYFGVTYDARIVDVARLHILRRMGDYIGREPLEGLSETEVRERCCAHLRAAYHDFVISSPIEERVFKVHRGAHRGARPERQSLVHIREARPTNPKGET